MREKLMPETQSLSSQVLSSRAVRGWGAAVIVTLTFLLGALPAGDSALVKAKQLVRQSTWDQALANEPASDPWPWEEIVMPAEGASVPRLGLSAAVMRDGKDTEPSLPVRLPRTSAVTQDPHLMPDVVGKHIAVTSSDQLDLSDTADDFTNQFAPPSAAPNAMQAKPVFAPQSSAENQL
jgi:hypothetical protein